MRPSIQKCLLKIFAVPVLAMAGLATAGCWHSAGSPDAQSRAGATVPPPTVAPVQAKHQDVTIDNFSFNPPTLTVLAGATITWVNHDDVPHTVTASSKAFTSKALDTDDRFSHVFAAPGTYSYFCAVHPHMTGQIIVK